MIGRSCCRLLSSFSSFNQLPGSFLRCQRGSVSFLSVFQRFLTFSPIMMNLFSQLSMTSPNVFSPSSTLISDDQLTISEMIKQGGTTPPVFMNQLKKKKKKKNNNNSDSKTQLRETSRSLPLTDIKAALTRTINMKGKGHVEAMVLSEKLIRILIKERKIKEAVLEITESLSRFNHQLSLLTTDTDSSWQYRWLSSMVEHATEIIYDPESGVSFSQVEEVLLSCLSALRVVVGDPNEITFSLLLYLGSLCPQVDRSLEYLLEAKEQLSQVETQSNESKMKLFLRLSLVLEELKRLDEAFHYAELLLELSCQIFPDHQIENISQGLVAKSHFARIASLFPSRTDQALKMMEKMVSLLERKRAHATYLFSYSDQMQLIDTLKRLATLSNQCHLHQEVLRLCEKLFYYQSSFGLSLSYEMFVVCGDSLLALGFHDAAFMSFERALSLLQQCRTKENSSGDLISAPSLVLFFHRLLDIVFSTEKRESSSSPLAFEKYSQLLLRSVMSLPEKFQLVSRAAFLLEDQGFASDLGGEQTRQTILNNLQSLEDCLLESLQLQISSGRSRCLEGEEGAEYLKPIGTIIESLCECMDVTVLKNFLSFTGSQVLSTFIEKQWFADFLQQQMEKMEKEHRFNNICIVLMVELLELYRSLPNSHSVMIHYLKKIQQHSSSVPNVNESVHRIMQECGEDLMHLGRFSDAKDVFEDLCGILSEKKGDTSFGFVVARMFLGECLHHLGDIKSNTRIKKENTQLLKQFHPERKAEINFIRKKFKKKFSLPTH